jgi:signal transduction histidine kinase
VRTLRARVAIAIAAVILIPGLALQVVIIRLDADRAERDLGAALLRDAALTGVLLAAEADRLGQLAAQFAAGRGVATDGVSAARWAAGGPPEVFAGAWPAPALPPPPGPSLAEGYLVVGLAQLDGGLVAAARSLPSTVAAPLLRGDLTLAAGEPRAQLVSRDGSARWPERSEPLNPPDAAGLEARGGFLRAAAVVPGAPLWVVIEAGSPVAAGIPAYLPLAGAVGLFAVAAALLAWYLAGDLTRSLERLVTMTSRGPAGGRELASLGRQLAAFRGVEEAERLADSLRAFLDRLLRTEQDRARLVSLVAHDLKTPLVASMRTLEVIAQADEIGANERKSLVRELVANDRRSLELVNNLIHVSRLESGEYRPRPARIDLAQLVEGVVARLRPVAEAGGASVRLEPGPAVVVHADPGEIERAAYNLVANAIKHGRGAPVEVATGWADGRAFIRVADHGPGIPEGEREIIFEPYYQPRVTIGEREVLGGSTGLGLYLCRRVAETHGGSVSVSTTPGGGATLVLSLPAAGPGSAEERA